MARKKLKEKLELFSHLRSINQIHPAMYILLNGSHWSARYNDALRALSLEVVSPTHILADLTLGLGKVVHDYLDSAK